ncbi:MAG: maltose ABC transporter substrate-binding protein [Cellulosilyticaceae bacterium]
MKMMKKLSMVSLAAMLAVSGVGCGKKEIPVDIANPNDSATTTNEEGKLEPEEGAELLIWIDNEKYGTAVAEGFNKIYPEVKVTVQEVGSVEAATKIELDGPAGSGGDIFMLPHDKVVSAIDSGILLPIDPVVVAGLEENISPNALKTVQHDQTTYGVPVAVESVGIFYNKDIVGEKPATTFEEIFAFAETFNDPKNNQFAFAMDVANAYNAYGFLTPYGFQLFGEDGTNTDEPGFDSEAFLKGLGFIQSLNKILPVQTNDLKGEFLGEQFKQGKIAYVLEGPWKIEEYRDAGMNIGVMMIPTVEGNAPTPFAGVQNVHVSAYTKYPNAATLFAEYMASEEGANILYRNVYKAPALTDTSVVEGLADDALLSVFVNQFENAFPMPSLTRMSYYWSIGEKAISLVFNGQVTPEEAQKAAMEEWNSLVASE